MRTIWIVVVLAGCGEGVDTEGRERLSNGLECPEGSTAQSGTERTGTPREAAAEWCERPDGVRVGPYLRTGAGGRQHLGCLSDQGLEVGLQLDVYEGGPSYVDCCDVPADCGGSAVELPADTDLNESWFEPWIDSFCSNPCGLSLR